MLARRPSQIFGMFKAAIAAQGPKLVEKVKGVIVYVITAGPKNKKWTFYTDLKNGEGKVGEGRVKKVRSLCAARAFTRTEFPRASKQQPSAAPPDARHSVRATSADAAVAFGPALGPLPCAYRRI